MDEVKLRRMPFEGDIRVLFDGGSKQMRPTFVYPRKSSNVVTTVLAFDPPVFTTKVMMQVTQRTPDYNALETVKSVAVYRTFGMERSDYEKGWLLEEDTL